MYRLGNNVKLHLFGTSHGPCVGCILDGIPPGISIDPTDFESEMDARKPKVGIGTTRREPDSCAFHGGLSGTVTDGNPIVIIINNSDAKKEDYCELEHVPRPGHADLLMLLNGRDTTGGGSSSGRLTAPIVAAGFVAKRYLLTRGISIAAFTRSIGFVIDNHPRKINDASSSRKYPTRACTKDLDAKFTKAIIESSSDCDSIGGTAECIAVGLKAGIGGEWFDSIDSILSRAMFSIPGVKGVEFGDGFGLSMVRGSESNDPFIVKDDTVTPESNRMGGVLGGMSDGGPLRFRVAFKPTPSISKEQRSVDMSTMKECAISIKGRHDPCIVPRAVSVVEAMTAIVLADIIRGDELGH